MSKHDDSYGVTALPTLLEFLGDTITYRKVDNTTIVLTAVLSQPETDEIDTDQGRMRVTRRTAEVGRTEGAALYSGIDDVDLREDAEVDIQINVAGDVETWMIEDIDRAEMMATLHLVRRQLIEWTMPDYRDTV